MENHLTLISKQQITEMRKLLSQIKDDKETYLELQEVQAELMKAKYDALLKQGFNEIQALELCKL